MTAVLRLRQRREKRKKNIALFILNVLFESVYQVFKFEAVACQGSIHREIKVQQGARRNLFMILKAEM